MSAFEDLTVQERIVLRALRNGPAIGIRAVAERVVGRPLCQSRDVVHLKTSLMAIRVLSDRGLIRTERRGDAFRIRLSRAGRRAIVPAQSLGRLNRLAVMLASVFALSAVAGCATQSALPSHQSLMGFPTITGLGQVRDQLTGDAVFVPCNPCAVPTTKTPVVIVPPEPMGRAADPVPVMMRGNLVATLVEPAARRPQPAVAAKARTETVQETEGRVFFAVASAKLDAYAATTVKTLAEAAKMATSVTVTGQTDSTGPVARNKQLARARAQVVRAALIAAGVPAARIKTQTCLTCFATGNESEEGRRQNRRTEISIAHA